MLIKSQLAVIFVIFVFQSNRSVVAGSAGKRCASESVATVCFQSNFYGLLDWNTIKKTLYRRYSGNTPFDYTESINKLKYFLHDKNLLPDEKSLVDRRIRTSNDYADGADEAYRKLKSMNELHQENVSRILDEYFYKIDDEVKLFGDSKITPETTISPMSLLGIRLEEIKKRNDTLHSKYGEMGASAITELIKLKRQLTRENEQIQTKKFNVTEVVDFVNEVHMYLNKSSFKLESMFNRSFNPSVSLLRKLSTLIPLPKPVIVPGDRFREIYYWDSYPIIRGLAVSGNEKDMINIIQNYFYLIDKIGFIPNGAREYYLDRSQPPLFTHSIAVAYSYLASNNKTKEAKELVFQALPRILTEYLGFWMNPRTGHVVLCDETMNEPTKGLNTTADVISAILRNKKVLNRYYSHLTVPRPESYIADSNLIHESQNEKTKSNNNFSFDIREMFRAIRAAAESGHDFSSRWNREFIEGRFPKLTTPFSFFKDLDTTSVLPVDLNAILFKAEAHIADFLLIVSESIPNANKLADTFDILANLRRKTMNQLMVREEIYYDYDFRKKSTSKVLSAASLFFYIATNTTIPEKLAKELKKDGGIVSTLSETGQQWDFPNAWAPLQGMLLGNISENWSHFISNNKDVECFGIDFALNALHLYMRQKSQQQDGLFVEKYNAVNIDALGGGGEYVLQRGFGWTNGVIAEFVAKCVPLYF